LASKIRVESIFVNSQQVACLAHSLNRATYCSR
jgi:hypothetical protein